MTIREYTEGYPVDIVEHNGRTCLLALNEGGNREVIIDLQDILAATTEQRVTVDRDDLRRLMGLLHDLPNYAVDEDDDEALDRLRAALKEPTP